MANPTYTVEVAFATANPLTTSPTWSDVSAYLLSFATSKGKDHELTQTQAGTMTVELSNKDRRFDPTYTGGAYYPNVLPMKQIRLRATYLSVTYELFRGFVLDWQQDWGEVVMASQGRSIVRVQAVDAFHIASLFGDLNTYRAQVLEDKPILYFPLDDPVGTLATPNLGTMDDVRAIASPAPGNTAYGRATAAPEPFTWETAADFTVPSGPGGGAPSQGLIVGTQPDKGDLYGFGFMEDLDSLRSFSVEAWVLTDTVAVGEGYFADLEDLTLPGDPGLEVGRTADRIQVRYRAPGPITSSPISQAGAYTAGTWTHIAIVLNPGTITFYKDGARFGNVVDTDQPVASYPGGGIGTPMYIGVGSSPTAFATRGWDGAVAHLAVYDYPLSADRVAAHYAATLDAFTDEPPGTVIDELLDQIGWPAGLRALDAGTSPITAAITGNALTGMLDVGEGTDRGILFADGNGALTFVGRNALQGHTPAAIFGDASDNPYVQLTYTYDEHDLYNTVEVTGADGTAVQTVTDATSRTNYGPRTLSVKTLDGDEADMAGIAAGELVAHKAPALRPKAMELQGVGSLVQQLTRKVGDRITIKRNPPGAAGTITLDAFVERVQHRTDDQLAGRLVTDWGLVPADAYGVFWLLADSTYGVLGSTTELGW